MSGHSKWSKVKHQKATNDVVKAAAFTKASRAITIAVREGGGVTDPDHNFHLRLAIEKAREVNMPKENIERAIDKGAGAGGGTFEQIAYEGYGPSGIAMYIEAATDNRQRTASLVKQLLDHAGGSLAGPGAVSYLFERVGVMTVPRQSASLDQIFSLALESGARDVVEMDDVFEVYTTPSDLLRVKKGIEGSVPAENAMIVMKPKVSVAPSPEVAGKVQDLVEALLALDDVQSVFTNVQSL